MNDQNQDNVSNIDKVIDMAHKMLDEKDAIFKMLKSTGQASSIIDLGNLRLTMLIELKVNKEEKDET